MWWIRTKEIGWFVGAVLISAGFGRGADAADVMMTFTLDNQSNVDILGVFAGPDYTFDWYESRGNLLGSALPLGHQRLFNVYARTGHCSFNLIVSWNDRGGERFERAYRGLNLCEDANVTFDGGRGLVISNKSRTSIKGVRTKPTAEREWVPNRLKDTFIEPGGKEVIMLRLPDGQGNYLDEQYKDHCIFDIRLITEESVVEYRQRNLCDDSTIMFFDENDRGLVVSNKSRTSIKVVRANPTSERTWGPNRLKDTFIEPGGKEVIVFEERYKDQCIFDILLRTEASGAEYRQQNLCDDSRIMFFDGNDLTVANEGEEAISFIYVSVDHERQGWKHALDVERTISPGSQLATRLHQFTEDQCLFDFLVQDARERQHVYEDVDVCNTARLVHPRRADGGAPTAPVVPREDLTVGETFQDCEGWGCPWMVVVDGGAFERGSKERDEAPVTKVTVSGPFAVGEFEVSVGQFEEFARDTGHDGGNACYIKARRGWRLKKGQGEWQLTEGRSWGEPGFDQDDSHPVVCVSWDDAIAYTRWLAGRTAMPYRLLTEAEAEWLATASATNFERSGRANCRNCGSPWDGKGTSPIGRMPPDDLGLHDVFGNAAEWVQDCYQSGYGNAPRDGSAWSPPSCGRRVVRGGCWLTSAQKLRASGRDSGEPDRRSSCVGFRVARDLGKE